jgi:hypothetical protein
MTLVPSLLGPKIMIRFLLVSGILELPYPLFEFCAFFDSLREALVIVCDLAH